MEHKETGDLPEGWEVVKVKDLGEVVTGTTPSTKVKEYWGEGCPFVTPTDFSNNKYVYETERSVTLKGIEKARIIPKDSVMVTCIASVGEVAMSLQECITNQQINSIICGDKANPHYVYYVMMFRKNILKRWAGVTTSPIIKKSLFEKFPIPLPPLSEQRKIAEILSTVDSAIQEVDEAIIRAGRVKKGLMQELLTKGIGHTEFKETEIGRIPEEWEVVRLEEIIKEIKSGFASGKRDKNGIVQIRMNNVTTDGRLIFDSYLKVPIPKNLDFWVLKKGDFLFNNTNSYELVGKSAIFEEAPFPCTFSNHFTRIRFNEERVLPEIVLSHFLMLWKKGYFKSVAIRHVGQSAVNSKYLLKLRLPLPPLSEQKKIAEILNALDEKIALEKERKARLERIKKGLMNDLLTGKKRVKGVV